eukprot:137199-Pleurochrysis_carterae.AAC.2
MQLQQQARPAMPGPGYPGAYPAPGGYPAAYPGYHAGGYRGGPRPGPAGAHGHPAAQAGAHPAAQPHAAAAAGGGGGGGGEWTEHMSPEGIPYYYNATTGASAWEKPADFGAKRGGGVCA